ncbi:DUF115 domain-containing protein [Mucilaginibacter gossypii]|uniref:6-hydroxymethylpterin diphosphokinase MptE-like protein n=1 Tax=Mucilaginibacter gossypii TaxID=551996 RepID=UPI000DCAEE77|nr:MULTISPECIES: 6-hydroxymethylpterin diphosphokinase MptE-like protein [Mucilaginibacter]QTE40238.1 DUF115 domain-containing protein [Mucilaginibacter gossypii]RAV57523.1 hypothetical protein DIU36_10960 [Mucilaginibacter rubeus]
MKSLLDKGLVTIKTDGVKVFTSRLLKYGVVKLKRLFRKKDQQNIAKWAGLKNKYKGERIFIIGNGPSINKMPFYLLENEYTFAFNRFNLMFERLNWVPDFYMVTDDLVIQDMYEQINNEILPVVPYAFFPDIHPSNVDFTKFINHADNVHWINADKPEFRDDLPNCGINKTVVNAAIQIAGYLGFTEIYLIGVDMTFADQKVKKVNSRDWEADEHDPNHFDPRYFGKGLKYHNPTVHEMMEKFRLAKLFFDERGNKIFNATEGGKLEEFPRVDFNSLFILSNSEKQDLLNNSKILKDRGLTFNELLDVELVSKSSDSYPELFRTDLTLGLDLIPKLIVTYLPLGPFKEQYYFVKRQFISKR